MMDKATAPSIERRATTGFGRQLVCLFLLAFLAAGFASAHPVLVPRPTLTLADRVLLSDALVLAREDPQRPFHYTIVKTIEGDPGDKPLDLFLPSQMRRKLAMDDALTMLLARDAKSGDWRSLGIASKAYFEVIERVLAHAGDWTPKETNNLPRLQEFSALLGHEDVRLHELAYLEIGRASYASIRTVGAGVSLERVRGMLEDPMYFDWRGLDIMLLGLSNSDIDRSRVITEMQYLQRESLDINLAAWATAYIEVRGLQGIDDLAGWYFANASRPRKDLQAVARALAGHANENEALRQPVVEAYNQLLDTHPGAAPDIAHDLIAWQRWDFEERMQALKPQIAKKDPLGVYKVNLYLQRAKRHNRKAQP